MSKYNPCVCTVLQGKGEAVEEKLVSQVFD